MKKGRSIQVRITEEEYCMIERIRENDSDFNVSRFIRLAIREEYKKYEKLYLGVGLMRVG